MKVICKSVVCICALFMLLLFAGCGSDEYSVKDFADVTVVGYTEHGSLSIKVSESAINAIYADGKKDKATALRFAETFRFSYDGQSTEDSYFTNGDVVTINVTYDESMARNLGVNFVDSSFDYTIEGLEDKVQVSPFDGLSVKFNGVAPYGTVQLDKSNCIQYVIDNVTFYCDSYDLSNGDKVVVRAEFNPEIAERNGYVFTEDVNKYTVVGLSKYVTTMIGVTYSSVTADMHYMVEQYVGGSETSYKSFNWYFGEEDSDTDTESAFAPDSDSDSADDPFADGADDLGDDTLTEDGSSALFGASGEETSSKKKKRKSNIQKIKEDFVLSDFDAKFEYTPVECCYALNPLQYSDNNFISVYKVKGTFVCTDTAGSGYIKQGDTVVGEIYVMASLSGGSVDVKNNLVYDKTTLENAHSYSIRTFPKYEDLTENLFKSTTYVVEKLDYAEDQAAYDKFVKDQADYNKRTRPEESHITLPSSSDSDTSSKKRDSSDESAESGDSDTDTESFDNTSSQLEYGSESGAYYGDDDETGSFDDNNDDDGEDNYDYDYSYGYDYGDDGYFY